MSPLSRLAGGITMAALMSAGGAPALSATFVYVSNAEDGDIGVYAMKPDGALEPLVKTPTGKGSSRVEIVAFD
jgi:hypothetical protein